MRTSLSAFASLVIVLVFSKPTLSVTSVPAYGQCGGAGYTGSTLCAAGSTCAFSNQWYSQCLPVCQNPGAAALTSDTSSAPGTTSSLNPPQTTRTSGSSTIKSTISAPGTASSLPPPRTTRTSVSSTVKSTSSAPGIASSLPPPGETRTSDSSSTVTSTSSAPGTSSLIPPGTTRTSGSSSTVTSTTSAPGPTVCPGTRTKFKYFGVNQSGAEFGGASWPGVLGTNYIWPSPSSIDFFIGQGFNTFRIPFQQERLTPPAYGLTGAFDQTYLNGLKTIVNYVTNAGAYAVIDPHNYMRYNNAVITSTSDFQTWWKNLASEFKNNSKVIFDVMNEPNGIDAQTVFNLNQVAVNGIRSSGATSQLILVEGTAWTGAWSWQSSGNAAAFGAIQDPNNNVAIQMHQYLDSDSSGTSPTCVSPTIGAERLEQATAWLKANNLKGFLGEIGGGSNDQCISAVQGALCSMQQSGVWIGALWWAGGPWWGDYFQSIEPPNGPAISQILPQALKPFL
ncbi:glycoside hydrolase family 5 protein [Hebeloma cylindrosporum]|uniref:cellulase n=1 Tax=Hebeloma cylindrosporum TaxID=76867 RepID=A0A0C3BSZ3_HEBCY|nr:glycoside hydrolase family 5 protein [Hebeloma cylindrosporum h7]